MSLPLDLPECPSFTVMKITMYYNLSLFYKYRKKIIRWKFTESVPHAFGVKIGSHAMLFIYNLLRNTQITSLLINDHINDTSKKELCYALTS